MFSKQLVLLVATALLLPYSAFSQKYLVVEKLGTRKRYEYQVGQEITYKLKTEDFYRTDVITQLETNVIAFGFGFYSFEQIEAVNIGRKPRRGVDASKFSPFLLLGGAGYFLLDQFNNSVINGNKLSINDNVLRTSSVLVGLGALPLVLKKRRVKLKRNWRLRLVDI